MRIISRTKADLYERELTANLQESCFAFQRRKQFEKISLRFQTLFVQMFLFSPRFNCKYL